MIIRNASLKDINEIAKVESESFPLAEAANCNDIYNRLKIYPERFWVAVEDGQIVACVNGMTTNESELCDEMYSNAELHNPRGQWQMIFSVCTLPQYQKRGYAAELLKYIINISKSEGRRGIVLTCKEELIGFYTEFGFVDEGISDSTHGGVIWHKMRLTFDADNF